VQNLRWRIPRAPIVLDADLNDWNCLSFKAQTPFRPSNMAEAGNVVSGEAWTEFAIYNGGNWNGIDDHSIAVGFAWQPAALYCGIKVVDDTHENAGSGWDGDSVQVAFADGTRTGSLILYNYGLTDDGSHVLHHQAHPCPSADNCTDAAMERFDSDHLTIYEIVFPAHSLGQDILTAGYQFGIGLCVNDGDTDVDGHRGQKGWSGWGAYSIMFGKDAAETGLAILDSPGYCDSMSNWAPVTTAPDELVGIEVGDLRWDIPMAPITLDASLEDWNCLYFKAQTPFRPCNGADEGNAYAACHEPWTEFAEYNGGHWNGIQDHSIAVGFAWQPHSLYCGIKVVDDTHENGNSGWNGDSVQIAFGPEHRASGAGGSLILYNYALTNARVSGQLRLGDTQCFSALAYARA
jgi:hypothetical protein